MRIFLLSTALLWSPTLSEGGVLCDDITDCAACVPECSWCPSQSLCHDNWSLQNPCMWDRTHVKDPKKCPATPPAPFPQPPSNKNSTFTRDILAFLFKKMKVDVDINACLNDVGNAEVRFKDFSTDIRNKKYKSGMEELGRGITALSSSIASCNLKEVQNKLDALAAAIHFAKITVPVDMAVQVLVGASDLVKDLEAVAAAVAKRDPTAVGDALNTLLDGWSSIVGSCTSNACHVLDGFLRMISVTAKDIAPCEKALEPAVKSFEDGATKFQAKDYKEALTLFATGFDNIATDVTTDACGLSTVAKSIADISSTLSKAVVEVEDSKEVKIIVGSANIYDELVVLAKDMAKKDYKGVGMQLGLLLARVKASECRTPMCSLVTGLLASLQVGFTDLTTCRADLDDSWSKIESLIHAVDDHEWSQAIDALGSVIEEVSESIKGCGVPEIASNLKDASAQFGGSSVFVTIAKGAQLFIKGADITPDFLSVMHDFENKQWPAVGRDLGTLSTWLTSTDCHAFTCRLMEGILHEADMTLTDLKPCEDSLRKSEQEFMKGMQLFGSNQLKSGLQYWAAGLGDLGKSIDACGLPSELKYLEQEANVLALGNFSVIGEVVSVMVHGNDVYQDMFQAAQDFSKQDFRSAGKGLFKVVNELSTWSTGHLCQSDACYIVNGVMQFVDDLGSDARKCHSDFGQIKHDLVDAFDKLADLKGRHGWNRLIHHRNVTRIREGIGEIGDTLQTLSTAVGDCHMEEFAELLGQLAVKMKENPQITEVENILKIVIHGVAIERDIGAALEGFAAKDYPAMGYALIKLAKILLGVGSTTVVGSTDTTIVV